jgi:hypothetical protein
LELGTKDQQFYHLRLVLLGGDDDDDGACVPLAFLQFSLICQTHALQVFGRELS